MSFIDKLFGEFIDIIEWIDDTSDTLVYRFERYGNEIKYGAKLTVREAQTAVFVNEGQIADVFESGMYELHTNNLPILSTLQGWPHGFESPFKAEVYFFNTRQFTDLKWGTKNPVMLRDPEFGPVRLRAFGTYTIKIVEPVTFLKEIVGTDGYFTTDEITNQLRNLIVSRFASVLGQSGIPVLDLAANYHDLSTYVTNKIRPEFVAHGLDVPTLLVENISLPPVVEEALDKRTSMGIVGNLKDYATFQAAEAMTAAAANPGGGAAEGIGLGIGFAMATKMADALGPMGRPPVSEPPPVPADRRYFIAVNGHQTGPFGRAEVEGQIRDQALQRDSLVWTEGLADWTPAGQVPELLSAFNLIPPPIPDR
jgi:membrane protease subunit (stomatin/prohibitin family)